MVNRIWFKQQLIVFSQYNIVSRVSEILSVHEESKLVAAIRAKVHLQEVLTMSSTNTFKQTLKLQLSSV